MTESVKRVGRPRRRADDSAHAARRDQIVAAAVEVFGKKGYDSASVEDVADALDMRKASIYYYVKSKDELLYLIFDRTLTEALAKFAEIEELHDPWLRLQLLIRHQIEIIADNPSYYVVFFDQRPRLVDSDAQRQIRDKERQYFRVYSNAVEAAITVGRLPKGDVYITTQVILGITNWVYKWFDPERDTIDQVVNIVIQLLR